MNCGNKYYLKASPLPPAPLANSSLVICELEGFAGLKGFAGLARFAWEGPAGGSPTARREWAGKKRESGRTIRMEGGEKICGRDGWQKWRAEIDIWHGFQCHRFAH